MHHCGTCRHTEPDANDLSKVVCFGGPPQVVYRPVVMQTPKGPQTAIAELLQRPSIPKGERACSLYQQQELTGANDAVSEPAGVAE